MTDHEWVDWMIEKIDKGECVWESGLKTHPTLGSYYKGSYNGWQYIFFPRPSKQSNASWRMYDTKAKDEPIVIHESHTAERKAYYKRVYSPENYDDHFGGYLQGHTTNSKVYKIEKAIKRQLEPTRRVNDELVEVQT